MQNQPWDILRKPSSPAATCLQSHKLPTALYRCSIVKHINKPRGKQASGMSVQMYTSQSHFCLTESSIGTSSREWHSQNETLQKKEFFFFLDIRNWRIFGSHIHLTILIKILFVFKSNTHKITVKVILYLIDAPLEYKQAPT